MLVLVVVAGALAACGGTAPEAGFQEQPPPLGEPGPPAESAESPTDTDGFSETGGGGTAPATTSAEPESDVGVELRPPPIALESAAGRQEAVQGSYCITKVTKSGEGAGACADTAFPHPEQLSIARPHEPIMIEITGASLRVNGGCSPACPSTVTVSPLGCGPDRAVASFELESASMSWSVDLEPGAYELVVFAYFQREDGSSGDTSGGIGLLVDPDRERAVVPIDEALIACPYAKQP
jgi:hypothetical protein